VDRNWLKKEREVAKAERKKEKPNEETKKFEKQESGV
jgi:hypothetical protein